MPSVLYLQPDKTLLDLNYARQVNEISLYTALGGGWQQ